MTDFFKKHTLIAGAVLLTAAGFLSRILGFFYKIFLSRAIGAEGLGIYQMMFPVYGICLSLCAGSLQTAISRFTAACPSRAKKTLFTGFAISFSMAIFLAALIWRFSGFLAVHVLMEPRCAPLLPAFALAIPCSALHSCICGYYYGKEKVQIPAFSQLAEQGIRMFAVFLLADICREKGIEITVSLAAAGLLIGEAGSALFTLLTFLLLEKDGDAWPDPHAPSMASIAIPLMALALPLMANRLVMNLLRSAESILIPNRLAAFGLSQSQAVSTLGVLNGMAMSFIMFPSAIVNSLAVVLLPSVARAQAGGDSREITRRIAMSFRYSLYMGILCVGIFTIFGDSLGVQVFKNEEAGSFITILAWLCPFLYLSTTMGSILNGLGKTTTTFLHHLAALLFRLCFIVIGIPKIGILAYLWGMLASELLLALLHILALREAVGFSANAWEVIVKPVFCLAVALGIYRIFPDSFLFASGLPEFFGTCLRILIVCACYGLMLLFFHRPAGSQS